MTVKMTLLELTQELLSAMESDEVNSITDTVESMQVATLIRGVYYDLVPELNLSEHMTSFNLEASGDAAKQVLMIVPELVNRVDTIRYDCREDGDDYPDYKEIQFMGFQDFLEASLSLREATSDVDSMEVTGDDGSTFTLLFETNKHPQFYTHIDDYHILFDSYDSSVDTTLVGSKTLCTGVMYPVFEMLDEFTPEMEATQFPLLRNKAKFRAFNELKQIVNQEAFNEVKRQRIVAQKRDRTVFDLPEVLKVAARYGRRGGGLSTRIPKNLKQGA